MIDVRDKLVDEFEGMLHRPLATPDLESVAKRGATIRRRKRMVWSVGVFAVAGLFVGLAFQTREVAPQERLETVGQPTVPHGSQTVAIGPSDRAALTAIDAMASATSNGMGEQQPYYARTRRDGDRWVSSFHLMTCSAPLDCEGIDPMVEVVVELDGDAGSVIEATGPLSPRERSAVESYSGTYAEGRRGFDVTDSHLGAEVEGLGTANGYYVWRGRVPTYGVAYHCTARVMTEDGTLLYEGADHEVILPAPDHEELRTGLVGVPIPILHEAASTVVSCDEEIPAEVPQHIKS